MIKNGITDNGTSSSIIKAVEQSDDQKIDLSVDNNNHQYLVVILSVSCGIIILITILIGSVTCWHKKKNTATCKSDLNSRSEEKSINKYSQLLINENQMTIGEMENTNSK